jgi:hypothetical protein
METTMTTAVLTRSYDNGRTGANMTETTLTPAKVAAKGLRRARSFVLQDDDKRIEAQPLYVPGITMPDGHEHDVLFVASMGNIIWAFDVDGHGVWKTGQLGEPYKPAHDPNARDPHGNPLPIATVVDRWGTNIKWGILSTPVIDLDANRMYFVNWRVQADGKPSLFAHRIDLGTMKPVGEPLPLAAQLEDAHGKPVLVHGKPVALGRGQKQRAALLLVPLRGGPKTLFIATTGGEKPGDPHGWMLAVDIETFTQTGAWVSTPSSFGGGMWHASQGPAADEQGNVYAITANGGYFQGHKNDIQDFNGKTDFAEAIVRLKYQRTGPGKGSLALDDWFIPFRDSERKTGVNGYDYRDQDLGSAAPVLPPDNNLLLGGGKDGILYVLDRHHLGKKVEDLSVLTVQRYGGRFEDR